MICPTCMAVEALLRSQRIPPAIAKDIAYDSNIKAVDRLAIGTVARVAAPKIKRGSTAASKKLSKSLKQVNKKARLKSSKLRKGWTQSKIMKTAHKMARK